MKAISAVIATIMLLMITVALIGVFYVFSSTMAAQTISSGGQQASQLTGQLSMCMQIDSIYVNQVTLRNCGKGVIANASLAVTMDDVALGASAATIAEGASGAVNISGLWQIQPGTHSLKISNGATFAQTIVDVQPNKNGLAGSWNFNEGAGTTANDGSGNGNIGTLVNGPAWISGKFGNALQFDGVDDYVQVPDSANLRLNQFTVEAWFNTNNVSKTQEIVNKRNQTVGNQWNYYLAIEAQKTEIAITYGNGAGGVGATGPTINSNVWYHVVGVFNGTHLTVYTNGVPGTSVSVSYTPDISTSWVGVGFSGDTFRYFQGIIDEVRIWNTALSPDQTMTMKQLI